METTFIEVWIEEHGAPPAYEWEICDHCRGEGTSTSYLGAYTQADREEMGHEWYEFADDVRAGRYDRACDECSGTGKVKTFVGEARETWIEWVREAAADAHTARMESGCWS